MEHTRIDPSEDPFYMNFVNKILNNPVLMQYKSEMLEPGVTDLVRKDWTQILLNSPVYQIHKAQQVGFSVGNLNKEKPFTTKTIIGTENYLELLVVGLFRLDVRDNFTCLVVVSCKATSVIGQAICPKGFQDNCRFFFARCGSLCKACRKRNIGPENIWCVRQTKVFDGDTVHCAQRPYVEAMFEGEFVAMARLTIRSKVVFGGSSKICGICKDIIFMKENSLLGDDSMGPTLTLHLDNESTLSRNLSVEELQHNIEDEKHNQPMFDYRGSNEQSFDGIGNYNIITKRKRLN